MVALCHSEKTSILQVKTKIRQSPGFRAVSFDVTPLEQPYVIDKLLSAG
jgi:hypothetical protein